jgi:hypothetical protein
MARSGPKGKYSPEKIDQAEAWLKKQVDRTISISKISKATGRRRTIYKTEVNLPTQEGLALELGIATRTLQKWGKKYEGIGHILEKINQTQVVRMFNRGLSGDYNATIAKLLLAKHGYKDESKVEVEDKRIILDK